MIAILALLLVPATGVAFAVIYARYHPIVCRACNETLSPVGTYYSGRSLRQWLNGGFDCPSCDAKLDINCDVVTDYPSANFRYLAMVTGIPLAALLAICMMRYAAIATVRTTKPMEPVPVPTVVVTQPYKSR